MESSEKILPRKRVQSSARFPAAARVRPAVHTHIYMTEGCFLECFSAFIRQMCLSVWVGPPFKVTKQKSCLSLGCPGDGQLSVQRPVSTSWRCEEQSLTLHPSVKPCPCQPQPRPLHQISTRAPRSTLPCVSPTPTVGGLHPGAHLTDSC